MNLTQNQKLRINGKECIVKACVLYQSVHTGRKYWKAFLSGGYELGYQFTDGDTVAFVGEPIPPLPYDYAKLPEEITYNGRVYRKDGEEQYERVVKIEFGDMKDSEGECRFVNYSAEDGSWLSPAIISETGARADFYGDDTDHYKIEI